MDIAKRTGRFFGCMGVAAVAALVLGGCVAETAEGEEAFGISEGSSLQTNPSYAYVQVGTLTHRRVRLANGVASVSVPLQSGVQNPALFSGQQVADFGALFQPRSSKDIDDSLVLTKLARLLGTQARWKTVANANADLKEIVRALDAASNHGCNNSDWRLATFKSDSPDFVCGTLGDGTKTLGKSAPGDGAGSGWSGCDIKATARASRTGDTVTLTFTRNAIDETISGQWYAGDGVPWEGADPNDLYRCPSSKCVITPTKLTSARTSVTFTATRVQGRKVEFITTGGACVYGPY